jgi:hypothetical protein
MVCGICGLMGFKHPVPHTFLIFYSHLAKVFGEVVNVCRCYQSETVDNITGLPDGWVVKFSKSKSQPYYYNINTLQSQWEPPHNANQDILKKYMAENYTATGPLTSSFEGEGNQAGKIRCAHLLVKHNKSRRASSWKQVSLNGRVYDGCHRPFGIERGLIQYRQRLLGQKKMQGLSLRDSRRGFEPTS